MNKKMKYIENFILFFLAWFFVLNSNFNTADAAIVKIYKLKDIDTESDKRYFNGGLYFYRSDTGDVVGFTLDSDYTGNKGIEITESEYLNYVESFPLTHKKIELTIKQKRALATNILISKQNKIFLYFLGKEVETAEEVRKIAKERTSDLLSDKLENNELNLIMLLFAYSGKVQFNQTGIQGVNSQLEADNYLTNFYNDTIKKINNIKNQAKQFIQDNNLN